MVDSPVALRNTLRRRADWQAPDATVSSAYLDPRDDPNVDVRAVAGKATP